MLAHIDLKSKIHLCMLHGYTFHSVILRTGLAVLIVSNVFKFSSDRMGRRAGEALRTAKGVVKGFVENLRFPEQGKSYC